MEIAALEQYLEKITLIKHIKVPEFDHTKGVSILLPDTVEGSGSMLMLATLNIWKRYIKRNGVKKGATYLICNDQSDTEYTVPKDLPVNFFLLSTSLDQLVGKLDQGIARGFVTFQDPMAQLCKNFMEDLKSGYLSDPGISKERFRGLYYPVEPHVACIIIQSENDMLTFRMKEEIEQAITGFFPDTNFFFYEKEWIVFFTQSEETTEKLNLSYEELSGMLKNNGLYAAISYPCQRPDILYHVYKTTSLALAVGLRTNYHPNISRVYTYKELDMLLIVHLASQKFKQRLGTNNTMYLSHPDAVKVYYHDLEENDNLLEILITYLSTGQNISECSKLLYMHRNTVHNKIKKIKEIIHTNLDSGIDASLLLISCTLLQYQKNSEKMALTDFL